MTTKQPNPNRPDKNRSLSVKPKPTIARPAAHSMSGKDVARMNAEIDANIKLVNFIFARASRDPAASFAAAAILALKPGPEFIKMLGMRDTTATALIQALRMALGSHFTFTARPSATAK